MAASLPLISHYQDDLMVHDLRAISENPKTPFLHVTRDYGTYLTMLVPADAYPAAGEMVPYLFGTADRRHILKGKGAEIDYAEKNHPNATVRHFDGATLCRVSYAQARQIIADYQRAIETAWRGALCHAA
jgi:hypothetical protein